MCVSPVHQFLLLAPLHLDQSDFKRQPFKAYRFLYAPLGLIFKILHGSRFALSVLYGSQNRRRLLLYTSLTDWFL